MNIHLLRKARGGGGGIMKSLQKTKKSRKPYCYVALQGRGREKGLKKFKKVPYVKNVRSLSNSYDYILPTPNITYDFGHTHPLQKFVYIIFRVI